MIRRPPRSTRTDTLFPYTTLFRSSVATMNSIAIAVERDPLYRGIMDAEHNLPEHTASDAITAAARQVAETINAAAIVTYTMSGSTALRAARERPRAPILCLTPLGSTARRLCLAWGVNAEIGRAHV